MAAPSFVTADYHLAHTPRCEVLEDDGSWARVTVYEHTANSSVVLWFGGTNYEGIGAAYHWDYGTNPTAAGAACVRTLRDGDGCVIETRPLGLAQRSVASGTHTHDFLPFKKALVFARSLMLKSQIEWFEWSKSGERPSNMPSSPRSVYKHDGWQGWGHWLGTGNIAGGQEFLPFEEALVYARSLELTTKTQWVVWSKRGARPADIPSAPDKTYRDEGWEGWGHWLVAMGDAAPATEPACLPFVRRL